MSLINKGKKAVGAILVVLAILALLSLILGLPLMLLWNWLLPVIFGVTKITFWQAVGLNFLCGILFKSNNTGKSSD